MEKTIKEWFESIPDKKIRKIALKNMGDGEESEKELCLCLSEAILGGFYWEESLEGHEFWADYHDKLHKNNT